MVQLAIEHTIWSRIPYFANVVKGVGILLISILSVHFLLGWKSEFINLFAIGLEIVSVFLIFHVCIGLS